MNGTRWLVIAFILVLGGLVAGYTAWQVYAPPASASRPLLPQERQFSLVLARVGSEETKQVLRWMPGMIASHMGDTVILNVTNADSEGTHGFVLPAANIFIKEIPPGKTVTVRFEARQPGIYMFSCALSGCAADHTDQKGQLLVLAGF